MGGPSNRRVRDPYTGWLAASMSVVSPRFTGKTRIEAPGRAFLERMKDRVQAGLLTGAPHWRSRYEVTRHTEQELAFRASDFVTAINVGLNEVELRPTGDGSVSYSVSYKRWAAYVVGQGALLGVVFLLVFLFWDIETQLDRYPLVADPALNRTVGVALFWGIVLFWTVVWPWILIVVHKAFARKLLNRIIQEVDASAAPKS
jgi:hypothetical protein